MEVVAGDISYFILINLLYQSDSSALWTRHGAGESDCCDPCLQVTYSPVEEKCIVQGEC